MYSLREEKNISQIKTQTSPVLWYDAVLLHFLYFLKILKFRTKPEFRITAFYWSHRVVNVGDSNHLSPLTTDKTVKPCPGSSAIND